MTKSRTLRKAGAVALSLAMALSIAGTIPASAAAKKVKLSSSKGTITVDKTKKVTIKNTKKANIKKVKFTYSKKKIAKATRSGLTIKVKGLKAGKTTITAKITLKKAVAGKKSYSLKYKATVKDAKPVQTVEPTPTVEPTATPEADLAITAEQIGASTIKVTSNNAVALTDKVTVKRGSSTVDSTFIVDADGKTITVTTGAKIAEAEYEVTVTPADTKKKAASAKFVGKAATLVKIDFKGENLVLKDTLFTAAGVKVFGYNSYGEEVALPSLTPYTTKGTVKYDPSSNEIQVATIATAPFQTGEKITITAIYQDGTNVQQVSKALTVSALASVAKLEFGELETTNTELKGKPLTINNLKTGTYYKTVKAEDQYGNTLTAKELNDLTYSKDNTSGTFFVSPNQKEGSYAYLDSFDTDAKKNVIARFKLGALEMPGKQNFTYTSVGGFSASDTIEVLDNPFIAELTVTAPEMYGGKAAELSVSAKDQDGNALDLFNYVEATAEIDNQAGNNTKNAFSFTDVNNTTKAHSTITIPAGLKFNVKKNLTKKTVQFTVTPASNTSAANVTYILVVQSAKPAVANVTCVAQTDPSAYTVSNKLKSTSNTGAIVRNGDAWNLTTDVQLLDQYGAAYKNVNDAAIAAGAPCAFTTTVNANTNNSALTKDVHVQVYDEDAKDYLTVAQAAAIKKAGKYTVELWGKSSATATDKVKKLDSKTFTLTVADTKYSGYTATLGSTDKLLYVGKVATSGAANDTESIKVTAKDSTGTTVTLKAGEDYTIGLDDVPNGTVSGKTGKVAKVSTTGGEENVITADQGVGQIDLGATPVTGEMTVNVYVSGESVASVKVPYSNAARKTGSYVCKKGVQGDTWATATLTSYELDDGIELPEVKTNGKYTYTDTENAQQLELDADAASSGATAKPIYLIRAVDQYGLSNFDARLGASTVLTTTSATAIGDYGDVTLSGTLTKAFKLAVTDKTATGYNQVAAKMTGTPVIDSATTAKGNDTLGTSKKMVIKGVTVYDQHGVVIASDDNTIMSGTLTGTYGDAALTSAVTDSKGELTLTVTSDASAAPTNGKTAIFTVGTSKVTITYVTGGTDVNNSVEIA